MHHFSMSGPYGLVPLKNHSQKSSLLVILAPCFVLFFQKKNLMKKFRRGFPPGLFVRCIHCILSKAPSIFDFF